jgi:histone-lysine N-methyltransferase SETD3
MTQQRQPQVQSDASRSSSCLSAEGGKGNGEGGDSEWVKALLENTAAVPGEFEKEMKMKGLLGLTPDSDPKLTANGRLIEWLQREGDVYLSEESSWGEAPHPMAISTETKDEITNESSGRGLLARRDINDGDLLLKIPMKLCMTKAAARSRLGKDGLPREINEYLAIACLLINEKYVMGSRSFYEPYIGILPETQEVNPTFAWSDEDLKFLDGSPVIAATKSLQAKLRREYDALLGGEGGLCARFPDRFPKEVSTKYCLRTFRKPSLKMKLPFLTQTLFDILSIPFLRSILRTRIGYGLSQCCFRELSDYETAKKEKH